MIHIGKFLQRNKNKIKLAGARSVIFMMLFLMPNVAMALTQSDLDAKNQELLNAKNALNITADQRKTLQGEVTNYNNQIYGIESQINATEADIARLNTDIAATQAAIVQAEADLAVARDKLSEILRVTYEEGQVTTLELIARSNNFSEFVDRSEYIQTIQLTIKNTADQVITLKDGLVAKRKTIEESKQKAEDLRLQQLAQQQQVAVQRNAKDILLQRTKGDEAAYQALVKKIQADYNTLQNQLWAGNGTYVSLGHVNAGDIIGYIGNSGYSTGCHLHFEIRNSAQSAVNPANYIGDGYFVHPAPGVWVSAPFGYSEAYFPGVFHTGIDYADGCAGRAIHATAEGDIIQRVSGRPNTYDWSLEYGNYVKIKHTNGMYSLYGHMR